MRQYSGFTEARVAEPLIRLDPGHDMPQSHPDGVVPRGRLVRPVLAGTEPAYGPDVRASETVAANLRLWRWDDSEAARRRASGRMLRRFRSNLHTLTHIARDPLLWYAEQGTVLTDLRETLILTETALRQFEATSEDCDREVVPSEIILAMANVVEDRVDRLFERMERLGALRRMLLRLSAILENIPRGRVPRVHEIEDLASMIVDLASADELSATLLAPESTERAVCVAAHAINVAQVVARLAITTPTWRDEVPLAVTAALLADTGMMHLPEELFDSPNLLTAPQRVLVQKHPAMSAAVVRQMRGHDERLEDAVYQHHERLDGSGYPNRLRAEAIGSVARLLGVVDVFVGIQSPRSYRPALSPVQAITEIDRAAGEGRLDSAWTSRVPAIETQWLKVPTMPEPPSGAPAIPALAA